MSQVINGSYHIISRIYDILDGLSEIQYHRDMRKKWISTLRNEKIIELGVGTGKNLPYYHRSNSILGIDAVPQMLIQAKKRIIRKNIQTDIKLTHQKNIPWTIGNSDFTVGVATFVFCTMNDPTIYLNALLDRIVEGGKLILFEYVRPDTNPMYAVMKAITPISIKLYGVNFNRKPTRIYLEDKVSSIKNTVVVPNMIEVLEIIK